jgi:hypothetical protein
MKKLLTMTLVCITLISTLSLAETKTNPSSNVIETKPVSYPFEYRNYKGDFTMTYDNIKQKGTIYMYVYHEKRDKKDFFSYYIVQCFESSNGGVCGVNTSPYLSEGKVAGNNWIIKDGIIDAHLGEKTGHLTIKTSNALTNAKLNRM